MAQQTAVEFLVNELRLNLTIYKHTKNVIDQAKAMEFNQMRDAVMYGLDEDGHTGDWKIDVAESYYIKTFMGENNS